jgi:hypothetical protein
MGKPLEKLGRSIQGCEENSKMNFEETSCELGR